MRLPALNWQVLQRRGYEVDFMPRGDDVWMCWRHDELGCRITPHEAAEASPEALNYLCETREHVAEVEIELEQNRKRGYHGMRPEDVS